MVGSGLFGGCKVNPTWGFPSDFVRGEPLYDTLRRRMLAENKISKVQAGMGLKRSVGGDPGLFGPGSMMWYVNRERIVLLSGPAAVTLQVAHPQVARLRQLEGFREVLKPLLLCWPALQIEKVGTTGGEELGSCLA